MNSILIKALFLAIRAYLGTNPYSRLENEINLLVYRQDLDGKGKMISAMNFAVSELRLVVNKYVLRGIIELILAKRFPNVWAALGEIPVPEQTH